MDAHLRVSSSSLSSSSAASGPRPMREIFLERRIDRKEERERHDNSLPEIIIENSVDAPHPPSLVP